MVSFYHIVVSAWCLYIVTAQFQKCNTDEPQRFAGTNAGCVNQQCTCNSGFEGDPFLACHPQGFTRCTVLNDPRGRNFAGDPEIKGVDIPVPCRYKLAHFETIDKSDNSGTVYTCRTEIFAAEGRNRGKFYESGFEVLIEYVKNPNQKGRDFGEYKFRVRASGDNGQIDAQLESRDDLGKDYKDGVKKNKLARAFGASAIFEVDDQRIGVVLDIPACGVSVFFRPADFTIQKVKDLQLRPGISIGVDQESKNVSYLSLLRSFCLTPDRDDISMADITEMLGLDGDEAFTYLMFASDFDQNFPGTPAEVCSTVSEVARSCTNREKRQSAMQQCFFILSEPKFIHCYLGEDRDTQHLLNLFSLCLQSFCQEDTRYCHVTQLLISREKCSHLANVNFVGFSCDFTPSPTGK